MNPAHKRSKQLKREARKARRTYHKVLNDTNVVSDLNLPSGNLLLVAHIQPISNDTASVTRALRSIAETTLAVAQAS